MQERNSFMWLMLTELSIKYFISGATAAISLYCGVKTPKNRRSK